MNNKLIVFCILILNSLAIAEGHNKSVDLNERPSFKYDTTTNDSNYNRLIETLIDISTQGEPWIQRKEIAAWGATVLFLTILGLIASNKKKYKNNCILIIGVFLYAFILFILFIHFINEQFGSMSNDIAIRSIYIFELVKSEKAYDKVPFPFKKSISKENFNKLSNEDLYDSLKINIRSRTIFERVLLPSKHIYYRIRSIFKGQDWRTENRKIWKNQPTTIEMEEAIQYDIMIISFLFFCVFLIPKKYLKKICNSIKNTNFQYYKY